MNHFPLVWWYTFRFICIWQFVCKLGIMEVNFLLISCLYSYFDTLPEFCQLFFISKMIFTLKSLSYTYTKFFVLFLFHRRSLDSFLFGKWWTWHMSCMDLYTRSGTCMAWKLLKSPVRSPCVRRTGTPWSPVLCLNKTVSVQPCQAARCP